jgi:alpha-tubulin suppressor-like RCC1 family protein
MYFSQVLKTDGTLWSWGVNSSGELGQNNTTYYSSPKQVGALTNWSKIGAFNNTTLAIKTDGTLWDWGFGGNGELGLGNRTTYSSPKQVGALTTWTQVSSSGGTFGAALKT